MENASEKTFQLIPDTHTTAEKCLTDEEKQRLLDQDSRLVPEFRARQLELQAQRNWDLFYKRNETRFFKDRHWTTREFAELLAGDETNDKGSAATAHRRRILEVGCGVGNLIYPLIAEQVATGHDAYFYYACDFSPRAVEFVRAHPLYDEQRVYAFQCDITAEAEVEATAKSQLGKYVCAGELDVVTMVFVLSAIHPNRFGSVLRNLWSVLKPGGVVLFRDYGRYDMAQLRFKPGHKIADNFYMRQDGTRSYYFAKPELAVLFQQHGFEVLSNEYVQRRTMNVKEGLDVPRIFLQGKFRKSLS